MPKSPKPRNLSGSNDKKSAKPDMMNLEQEELVERLERLEARIADFEREQSRVNTLYFITRSLSQELDLDNLLQLLMDEVKRTLQADRCTVFLVEEETGELWSRIGHGLEEYEIRFSTEKGIAGYVATTGEVVKIDDCYSDDRFNREIDMRTGYLTRNMLAFPMRNKLMEIIGVFQVLNKSTGSFNESDVHMLEAIAPIAAVQIENAQLYEEVRQTFDSFIHALAQIIDARDPLTAGHSNRIMLFADAIAMQAGWESKQREVLKIAALLHDLGKIGIREGVLTKKGKLTKKEFEHLKSHVVLTRSFLDRIHFSREYKQVPAIASTHHERINGSGYPDGLKKEEIPVGGQILAVVDIFDALTSKRHYRERMDFEEVMTVLNEAAGVEVNADIVESFKDISLDQIVRILEDDNHDMLDKNDLNHLKQYSLRLLLRELDEKELPKWAAIFFKYYHKTYLDKEPRR